MSIKPKDIRAESLIKLQEGAFDVVVIGGGVTGAGIALDAVSRGFKVALIEMQDFAGGTSSRSTKLIHGGLRYLKQMQFNVVYRTGRERAIAHRIAPYLVHPEPMLLPVVKGGLLSMNSAAFALNVYDRLAGVESEMRKKRFGKEQALILEPLLPPKKLKGALLYSEYRTDDARLTIELIKKAQELGAVCINYLKTSDFIEQGGRLIAIMAEDQLTKGTYRISAKHFVNACGVWTDTVWNLGKEHRPQVILPSKGVHLVFHRKRLPIQYAIYFDAPDGRMIFAIPRGSTTYVGTTDDQYEGDLKDPVLTDSDMSYILRSINDFFELEPLTEEDIISHWVGIRPLIKDGGKKAGEVSRRDEIFISKNGLISITGGKLTGYRAMAKKTVDRICKQEGSYRKCITDSLALGSEPFKDHIEVVRFIQDIEKAFEWISLELATYLVHNYGKDVQKILSNVEVEPIDYRLALAKSELEFCIAHESVCIWDDFAVRRTGWRYFHPAWEKAYRAIGELLE